MTKLTKVLEAKENDNTSVMVGKHLIAEGLRYAVGFGTIGLVCIGIGKLTETKEKEVQEEEQGE